MHQLRILAILGTLLTGAASATAADLGRPYDGGSLKDEYVAPVFRWHGFYMGAHAGYGWSDKAWTLIDNAGDGDTNRIGTVITSHSADGWLGGIQAGFNHQAGQFVYGIEGELAWTGMEGSSAWVAGPGGPNAGVARDATTDINWLATVAGRLGVTFDRSLVYVKLGAAWADEDYAHTGGSVATVRRFTESDTRFGWLLGAGLEHAIDTNWSVKFEYNYIDFGDERMSLTDGTRTAVFDIDQDMHIVKMGLNYRFDWDRAAPLK